jgi:hypothetical protein
MVERGRSGTAAGSEEVECECLMARAHREGDERKKAGAERPRSASKREERRNSDDGD